MDAAGRVVADVDPLVNVVTDLPGFVVHSALSFKTRQRVDS
jgi:hypothetical protein